MQHICSAPATQGSIVRFFTNESLRVGSDGNCVSTDLRLNFILHFNDLLVADCASIDFNILLKKHSGALYVELLVGIFLRFLYIPLS